MVAQGASVQLARLDLRMRSEGRASFESSLSGPDGWDMILVLYLADADGLRLTAEQAIEQAGARQEAGRRRVAHLSHTGVIVGDGDGRLHDVVTLAPEAITRVEALLERALAALDKF